MKKSAILLLLCIAAFALLVQAQPPDSAPDPAQVQLVEIASGFTRPLNLTHAGDDRLFVVEQNGQIRIIQNGAVNPTPFLDVSSLISLNGSEQGLLGLAFHPNYAQNGWFFINYTNTQGDTVVTRYNVSPDPNVADASSATPVLTVDQPYSNHNGGHLTFGPDGMLTIGLGDGGSAGDPQNRAQNTQTLLGKMLRINVDQLPYSVPPDNPFAGDSAYLPEIWSLGLRNPWRYSFDSATGDLYIADVGQNEWEEVNFQPAGAGGYNYGWPVYEGTHPFKSGQIADAVMPFAEYNHSLGCSVTGGYVYRGSAITTMQGAYFYGDFCSGRIWSAYRDTGGTWQSPLFMDTSFNISAFGQDQNGELYVVDHGGRVLRFEPVAPASTDTPPPTETVVAFTETPEPTFTPVTETATPEPTSTPLPPPNTPTLRVDVAPASAPTGATVNAALNLFNVENLYGLEVMCTVDPAVLAGTGYTGGEFAEGSSIFVDKGYQPDGSWVIGTSRLHPNPPISGNVTALTLNYIVQNPGASEIVCSVLAVDSDGRPLPLDVQNAMFTGEDESQPTETPVEPTATDMPTETPVEPTATDLPTETPVEPTATETPTETLVPTEATPTETVTPTGTSAITGLAAYQNRPDNTGINVELLDSSGALVAEQITAADGSYQFTDVPLGAYRVRLSAPQHLAEFHDSVLVETEGQTIDLPPVVLRAGDVDGNGIIDLADATLIGANFGVSVPPAPPEADLNGDGIVNVSDLALAGGNLGLEGAPVEPPAEAAGE